MKLSLQVYGVEVHEAPQMLHCPSGFEYWDGGI